MLTLGGGPAATTLEVAIYQALRFDFDPGARGHLTLLQIALTVIVHGRAGAGSAPMSRCDANLSVARRTVRPGRRG